MSKKDQEKKIFKRCHGCGHVTESHTELEKCLSCGQSFLPSNYFGKVHSHKDYKELFSNASELYEEDLVKGLSVIW